MPEDQLWQRFSNPATNVIHLAQHEARRVGSHIVGTEHLLLGMVSEGEGGAARVLERLGVSLGRARAELTRQYGTAGQEALDPSRLTLSPKAKKSLEYALEEARDLNPKLGLLQFVETEHLLLGLVRAGARCKGVRLLKGLGVDIAQVRKQAISTLGGVLDEISEVIGAQEASYCRFDRADFVAQWGANGEGDGQFRCPVDVAIAPNGTVYALDLEDHRVQAFTPQGQLLRKWGGEGTSDGLFRFPTGIAVDTESNLYVADSCNHRIQQFAADGSFLAKFGSEGSGDGRFKWPSGIAVDGSGHLYVLETGNCRVQKFTRDGNFITRWGSEGTGDEQFKWPTGLAVHASAGVFVIDLANCRVQRFSVDGVFLGGWGEKGSDAGQFWCPNGIEVDADGLVYVADTGNSRIQVFTPAGEFLMQWGKEGDVHGKFSYPYGLAIDPARAVYVADTRNHRLQGFQLVRESKDLNLPS